MQAFFDRYHKVLYAFSGAILVIFAFAIGVREGEHSSTVQPVTLLCKDDVLKELSIPVQALANGVTTYAATDQPADAKAVTGHFVGSKNGTKYYLPSCSTAKRIKPANYIWFSSAQDAQIQGYTPGKC